MYKLYWWLISVSMGLCIVFLDRSIGGFFFAWLIATLVFSYEPEHIMFGDVAYE